MMMRTGHGHKNIRGFSENIRGFSPLSPPLAPPLVTPTAVRFIVSVFLCLLCSCRMSFTQMTCSHFRKNRPKKRQKPAGCRSRIISKNRPVPIFGRSTGASLLKAHVYFICSTYTFLFYIFSSIILHKRKDKGYWNDMRVSNCKCIKQQIVVIHYTTFVYRFCPSIYSQDILILVDESSFKICSDCRSHVV